MSHILFGNTIDMLIIATPSTGYIVAYDLDNTLKQKDSNGVLSPIGGSQDLKTVLKYGNDSATYSITLGTYSEINSNAGGRILLSEGGTQSILLDVRSLSSTSSINLKPSGISLFNNSLTNNNTLLFNMILFEVWNNQCLIMVSVPSSDVAISKSSNSHTNKSSLKPK